MPIPPRPASSAPRKNRSAGVVPAPVDMPLHSAAVEVAAELVDSLPLVMGALRSGMRRSITDGLSVPQFRCLAFITRQPGTSVSEVSAFLGVTMATTSAMIDRLSAAGYVSASVSETDRRRAVLNASASGVDLVQRMRAGGKAELAGTLAGMSAEELETVRAAAALLRRSFHRG